jgi:hypothetical protein
MYQSNGKATFKTFVWSAMKVAVAGANVVNAVSSFVSPVIHTDTLLLSVMRSAEATEAETMKTVAVSASALRA